MGILGVLWVVLIVLKFLGLIATSWWLIVLWPIPVAILLWIIFMIFGVAFVGLSTLLRRR